jgi:hypothetical protein
VCAKTLKQFAVINRRKDVEYQNFVYFKIKGNKSKGQLDKGHTLQKQEETKEKNCVKHVKGRDDVQETAQTLFLQTTGGVTQKEV